MRVDIPGLEARWVSDEQNFLWADMGKNRPENFVVISYCGHDLFAVDAGSEYVHPSASREQGAIAEVLREFLKDKLGDEALRKAQEIEARL
jgi:hypothetical protein